MRGWGVLFLLAFLYASDSLAQPTITYEDVQGWTGGKYATIWFDDWGEWPCFYSPEQYFDVTPGKTWDFREYPFNDTIEWKWDAPGGDQKRLFPDADHIERDRYALLGPTTFLDTAREALTFMFSLESTGLYLYGSQSRAKFSDSLFSREYQWPDTVMSFPVEYGDRWNSHMLYAREARGESLPVDSIMMESLWARREANSYGYFVDFDNDTIPVLGVRVVFDLNWVLMQDRDWNFYQHSYLWFSKSRGLVGWARVLPVDIENLITFQDTTILRPGAPMDWCGAHSNYVLLVSVRLPEDQQGLAPSAPGGSGRLELADAQVVGSAGREETFDITGRRLVPELAVQGAGVRIVADGRLVLAVR